uniref:Membrane integral NOTCH2 associated receptor 2 n=1 Tax=Leptobrachium leishanense TaxID=445787 RepID=A0A8C5PRH0_9ANUR
MDLSVLPNNNHPDKFLRLDVRTLIANSGVLQNRQFNNKIYWQVRGILTKYLSLGDNNLSSHITPEILKSKIRSNPLYVDKRREEKIEPKKKGPSWTIEDFDKQSPNAHFSLYLKENPNDLQYWLEDIYTPGYDSLLKKNEEKSKKFRYCKIFMYVALGSCILVAIVIVTVLFT